VANIIGTLKSIMQKPDDKFNDNSDEFTPEQQKEICDIIRQDIEANEEAQADWIEKKKRDLQHKFGERPSVIEGLTKESWQADRNLGVAGAVADAYHSTLSATCINPDSIHYAATEENPVDNKDNLERFTKAILGKEHVNALPEMEDYIQNKVEHGFACFEVGRKIDFEWVDREIPITRMGKIVGYETKTEKLRVEKGFIENIANLDDLLLPRYGSYIQDLPNIIRVIHLRGDDLIKYGKTGQFMNVDSKFVMKVKGFAGLPNETIEQLKAEELGLEDVVDAEFRNKPIDIYKWFGWYEKDGKYERYRFYYEKTTHTLLAGKPLRKITKSGKYPFVGGALDKIVGQIRGRSVFEIIQDPVNALNEVYNQKSDFQYVTNCPFGFHKASEGYTKAEYKLTPMVSFPTEGNPNEEVYFPNLQRSMAWASQDIQILFEVIEKRTGAATYFQTNERNASGTATRDMIVSKNSETRFGRHTNSTQAEFCEAINMLVGVYQEHMPSNLGRRILGEDGKALFRNLSVETIRYSGSVKMAPDVIAGSKAYERQVMLWAFGALQQSVWFDPRINPKGNWLLTSRVMKSQGMPSPEAYLPPEPKAEIGTGKDIDNIWTRLMQGEVVELEDTWNIPNILTGLYKKKESDYFSLDPEYRPNLDNLIFNLEIGYQELIKKVMEDQLANAIAQRAIAMGQGSLPQSGQTQPPFSPAPSASMPGPVSGGMPQNMAMERTM